MRIYFILFSSVIALLFSCSRESELITLVDPDSSISIVIDLGDYSSAQQAADDYVNVKWSDNNKADDAVCTTALAAVELQTYLSQLLQTSPADIPILGVDNIPNYGNLVFIGNLPPFGKFKRISKKIIRFWKEIDKSPQAFRFDTFNLKEQNILAITGRTRIGRLYGVYEFLDHLGVRWIAPNTDAIVPTFDNLILQSTHEFFDPALTVRGFWMDSSTPDSLITPELYVWMARNRLNLFRVDNHYAGYAKQRGIQANTGRIDLFTTLLNPFYPYRYNHPDFDGDESLEIDPYLNREFYQGDADGDRVLSYWEAHPEWFVENVDSSALADTTLIPKQICISNIDAVKEFSKLIVDKLVFGEWQNCDIVDIWAPEAWCREEKCQSMGNDTDKLLYLVYHIQKEIKAARVNRKLARKIDIHAYAHHHSRQIPTVELPEDFDMQNTTLFLYTGPRCYNHLIIDPACMNINMWFSKALVNWLNDDHIFSGQIAVLENYNAPYYANLPGFFYESMRLDLPAYQTLGVQGLSYRNFYVNDKGVQPFMNYQFARQIWNANNNAEEIKNEFMQNYYGPAADSMQTVFNHLGTCMKSITTWRYFMPLQLEAFADSALAKSNETLLFLNERFQLQNKEAETNFNALWDQTYSYIYETRYTMDEVLAMDLPEPFLSRIKNVNKQLHYAEAMINIYDNLVYFLTLGNDDPLMRDEAVYRMKETVQSLDTLVIPFSPIELNALDNTGVRPVIEKILNEYQFSHE